jgi:hypothetical protein
MALGLVVAGLSISEIASGAVDARVEQSLLIALPVVVYITTAVIGHAWTAWPVLVAAIAGLVLLRSTDLEPVLGLSAAAATVVVVGLLVRRLQLGTESRMELLGAFGFGALVVTALYVEPRVGGVVVGLGLIGHAIWDVVHYRRDMVVPRPFAEFCGVLDSLVGVAVLVATVVVIGR